MRFIPTKAHAAVDYVAGIVLVAIPFFWRPAEDAASWVLFALGAIVLLQALFTDYELSLTDLIPMPAHLATDGLLGVLVAASPWLFGFYETIWVPHVVIGLLQIGAAVTTETHRRDPAFRRPASRQQAT